MPDQARSVPTMPALTHTALGGQVLGARTGLGNSLLYLSPLRLGAAAPVRGGVPVLFPQFADRGSLPKHGFARTAQWVLAHEARSAQAHSLRYELAIASGQFPDWPHDAHLTLHARMAAEALHLALRVTNTGKNNFTWTGGLHPYWAVEDVRACSLTGLAGLSVQDRYDARRTVQTAPVLAWNEGPMERLYDGCPPLTLRTGSRQLTLTSSGFDQWMIWNPGQAGGDALPDLPPGDWQRFICIEPVCVSRPVVLAPGSSFSGSLDIRVSPDTLPKV